MFCLIYVVGVQSLNRVRLYATPQTAAHQASLSFTISRSLLKLMSIELLMPDNCLILCCPLLLLPSIFPSIRVFSTESALCIKVLMCSQSIGVSASTLVLPMNIQGWFPLLCKSFCFWFSHSVMSDSLQPHGLQNGRLPGPSLSPKVCSNPCPLSR